MGLLPRNWSKKFKIFIFNPFIFINKKRRDISLTVFTDLKHMNYSAGIRDLGIAIIFISRRSKPGDGGGLGSWRAGPFIIAPYAPYRHRSWRRVVRWRMVDLYMEEKGRSMYGRNFPDEKCNSGNNK